MIFVTAANSGGGAIVDVSWPEPLLLGGACDQTFEAIRSDDDFVARTGYSAHSYEYLSLWTTENQPDAAQRLAHEAKQESLARLKNDLGSPTASELLLATKIADIDTSTVRWNLSLAALQMFDAAIREILDYFADSNPPYVELELLAGGTEEEFRTLQQEITDILEAINSYEPRVLTAAFGSPGGFEQAVPAWVNTIEYVMVGAGGGGGNPTVVFTGQGGDHGSWSSGVLKRYVDFAGDMASISGVVGAGGVGGFSAADGGQSLVTYTGLNGTAVSKNAPGGAHGGNGVNHNPANSWPHSAGAPTPPYSANGVAYPGSAQVSYGQVGGWPGGGGGGAFLGLSNGGPGAHGYVWLTLKSAM